MRQVFGPAGPDRAGCAPKWRVARMAVDAGVVRGRPRWISARSRSPKRSSFSAFDAWQEGGARGSEPRRKSYRHSRRTRIQRHGRDGTNLRHSLKRAFVLPVLGFAAEDLLQLSIGTQCRPRIGVQISHADTQVRMPC